MIYRFSDLLINEKGEKIMKKKEQKGTYIAMPGSKGKSKGKGTYIAKPGSKKEAKKEEFREKLKGDFSSRILKNLLKDKEKIVVSLLEGKEIIGVVRGVGQYAFVLHSNGADTLIFKHAIKYILSRKEKFSMKW